MVEEEVNLLKEADGPLEFEDAYGMFLNYHIARRTGPNAKRIKPGLEHAEKLFLENVWWPAFRNFDALHPEYEIRDFKEGHRYIDFAYIQKSFRVAIEIDGIGSHWKDISQDQYSDHCDRQNHLVIDGWLVLRFSYNRVRENPRLCQQAIQQLIGRITGDARGILKSLNLTDREIVRLALSIRRPITARDVSQHTDLCVKSATQHLRKLSSTGWLQPAGGSVRIHSYRVHPSRENIQL